MRGDRAPAVGDGVTGGPGQHMLRRLKPVVHTNEGLPVRIEAVELPVHAEEGVMVAALAVFRLVIEDVIRQFHPVHLAAMADGHEEQDIGLEAVLLPRHAGIAHAMPALVGIQFRLAGFPARIPDRIAVLDIVIAPARIHRHTVIAVPENTAELGVLAEAVATGGIGNQGEEILRPHIIDPRPRRRRVRDDILPRGVVEMSEFVHRQRSHCDFPQSYATFRYLANAF